MQRTQQWLLVWIQFAVLRYLLQHAEGMLHGSSKLETNPIAASSTAETQPPRTTKLTRLKLSS